MFYLFFPVLGVVGYLARVCLPYRVRYISMMSWSGYDLLRDATYQWCFDPDMIYCVMLHINDVLIQIWLTVWCYILMSWSGHDLRRDATFLLLSVTNYLYKSICIVASQYHSYSMYNNFDVSLLGKVRGVVCDINQKVLLKALHAEI